MSACRKLQPLQGVFQKGGGLRSQGTEYRELPHGDLCIAVNPLEPTEPFCLKFPRSDDPFRYLRRGFSLKSSLSGAGCRIRATGYQIFYFYGLNLQLYINSVQ